LKTKCFWTFSISRIERKKIVKNKIPMFGVQICAQCGFGGFASPKVKEKKNQ
jgi:hypothetical protein